MGLRTVRDDAGPISFHHAFVRQLVGVVEIWVLSGVPALISALVSPKGKRLGDYLAGTYVVRDRVPLRLPRPVQMPPYLAQWAATADIAPLPDALAVAMRQLVGRAATLTPSARERLVTDAGGPGVRRLSHRPHPPAPTRRTSSPRSPPSDVAATSSGSVARPSSAGGSPSGPVSRM